jgi:hypothetical protein
MTRVLIGLEALGWWTRWLLVAVLWWGVYRQRRQVLGFLAGERRAPSERNSSLTRRVKEQLEGPRAVLRARQRTRDRDADGAPAVERRGPSSDWSLGRIGHQHAQAATDHQATSMLEREHAAASADVAAGSRARSELSAQRTRLQRVRGEHAKAAAAGDARRAGRLAVRAKRIEGEVERGQLALNEARRAVADGKRAQRRGGRPYTTEQARERGEWLDAQAALPASRLGRAASSRAPGANVLTRDRAGRDYPGLSAIAGYSRAQYEQLSPRAQRQTRLEIDHELALRHEGGDAADVAGATARALGRRDPDRSRSTLPGLERESAAPAAPRPDSSQPGGGFESPVMRDAYEVSQGRKRQLGWR